MKQALSSPLAATAVVLSLLLAGCAAPPSPPARSSYVVLLPSPDGSVGQVVVQGQSGQQVLTKAQQGVALDGKTPPFEVKPEDLQRDFGAAMAARPPLPEQFLLYFETGGTKLTTESEALLPRIIERAKARKSLDMSVIGHSDTQGQSQANEALALQRASAMATQLRELGLMDAVLSIESHGERNLLVATPDDSAEPRNRRVEITLR
ncbi:OmpA family protein [Rhodoferax sp.]|uniref:OmpA family protein n=1 Tax=Rhodoferax sp. TaxID=50421 RepID=UPI00271D5DE6|nr:OmpA family protein [Rhodoferax sp.]MDO8319352.1 OmpA family protein [Rhodoferax sp.]